MKTEDVIKEIIQAKKLWYDMVQPGTDHKPTDDPIYPTQTVLSTWVRDNLGETDPNIKSACKFLKAFSKELKKMLYPEAELQSLEKSQAAGTEKEERKEKKEFLDLYSNFVTSIRKFFNWSGIAKEPRINRKQELLILDKSKSSAQSVAQASNTLIVDDTWLLNHCSFSKTDLFRFLEKHPEIAQLIAKNGENLKRVNNIYSDDLSELGTHIAEHNRARIRIKQKFDLRETLKQKLYGKDANYGRCDEELLQQQWDTITRQLNLDMLEFLKTIQHWSEEDNRAVSKNLDDYDFDYIASRYNGIFEDESYDITAPQKERFEKNYQDRLQLITKAFDEFRYRPNQTVQERPFGVRIDLSHQVPCFSLPLAIPSSDLTSDQEMKVASDQELTVAEGLLAITEETTPSAPVRTHGVKRSRELNGESSKIEAPPPKKNRSLVFR